MALGLGSLCCTKEGRLSKVTTGDDTDGAETSGTQCTIVPNGRDQVGRSSFGLHREEGTDVRAHSAAACEPFDALCELAGDGARAVAPAGAGIDVVLQHRATRRVAGADCAVP